MARGVHCQGVDMTWLHPNLGHAVAEQMSLVHVNIYRKRGSAETPVGRDIPIFNEAGGDFSAAAVTPSTYIDIPWGDGENTQYAWAFGQQAEQCRVCPRECPASAVDVQLLLDYRCSGVVQVLLFNICWSLERLKFPCFRPNIYF
jgi:hypothetical protein